MKTASARLNYLRIAPRKVRLVASALRGLSAQEAEAQLILRTQRSRTPLLKLLRSALANAKNKQLAVDRLVVAAVRVDQGPMLKRSLPRALGRVTPIQKKMSHVTLVLAEGDKSYPTRYTLVTPKKEKKGVKRTAPKRPAAKLEETKPKIEKKPGFFQKFFRRKSV